MLQLHGWLQLHQQLQLQLAPGSSLSASSAVTTSWISKVSASSWRNSVDNPTMVGFPFADRDETTTSAGRAAAACAAPAGAGGAATAAARTATFGRVGVEGQFRSGHVVDLEGLRRELV
ncbi:hypothetical protein [Actinokineospora sp.]|uniref:hypothetical protein n=1 Tax=Actinokineospora sp. TaxID=1872133 RepID=UPI004037E5F2